MQSSIWYTFDFLNLSVLTLTATYTVNLCGHKPTGKFHVKRYFFFLNLKLCKYISLVQGLFYKLHKTAIIYMKYNFPGYRRLTHEVFALLGCYATCVVSCRLANLTVWGPFIVIYSYKKPKRSTNFPNLFFEYDSTCFRTVSLSIIRSLAPYTQQ